MGTDEMTPLLRQYAHFKGKHPDTVLLFRVGDFYESYLEDAQILHDRLGLTLTTREGALGQPVKLAGVPKEYVDDYLKRLLTEGYRVALCEQVTGPTDVPEGARGCREVTEDRLLGGLRRGRNGGVR